MTTPPSTLATQFDQFAETECRGSSALYHTLSKAIAGDSTLLAIAAHTSTGQPRPNLFLAAVHYLIARAPEEQLAGYYPDLNPASAAVGDVCFAFKDFVLRHEADIITLLQTRLVQTNEVRRSAYLFPAFQLIARHAPGRPLALIEIGTSAGFNLLWDQYRYTYNNDGHSWGRLNSLVTIAAEIRGGALPRLEKVLPRVSHRIGFDLKTIELEDPDQERWMRALVWPEHEERRNLLDAAISHRRQVDLDLRMGDGFTLAPLLLKELPADCVPCFYHTHVANQVSAKTVETFQAQLTAASHERDVVHLHNNVKPSLHLTASFGGRTIDQPIARTDPHARWFEWLGV